MTSFNEVCIDVTKTARKIPQSDYLVNGKYKIFDQGKDYIGGYTDDDTGIVEEYPYIVFGDHTRIIKFVNEPCFIGADGVKLLKVYNLKFLPKYVYYSLVANPIVSSGYSRHFKYLKEQSIRDCSINEQKRIITELENHEKAISIKKESLSSLDELVKSRFIEMFENKGFPQKTGKELFKFSSGKFLPSERRLNSGIPVYGGNGIAWYTDTTLIPFDTLVIGRVGAYCGNVRLVKGNKWITDNALYISSFKTKDYSLEFLEELMKMCNFHQFADASAQPKITQKPLENLTYIIPPIELQNEFAGFVKLIDKSKFIVQQQIKDLQELVDSKMDEYFR